MMYRPSNQIIYYWLNQLHLFQLAYSPKNDCYVRRRWQRVQYIAGQFWKRWKEQYLHLLQQRQKWQKLLRNSSVDDIVLAIDQPRGIWVLARVEDVSKDRKGLVNI